MADLTKIVLALCSGGLGFFTSVNSGALDYIFKSLPDEIQIQKNIGSYAIGSLVLGVASSIAAGAGACWLTDKYRDLRDSRINHQF